MECKTWYLNYECLAIDFGGTIAVIRYKHEVSSNQSPKHFLFEVVNLEDGDLEEREVESDNHQDENGTQEEEIIQTLQGG